MLRFLFLSALLGACPAFSQNPLEGLLNPASLQKAERHGVEVAPGARTGTVVLKFTAANTAGRPVYLFHEEPWQDKLTPGSLTVPVPAAARDWTRFGALTFEFCSNSAITWELRIRNRQGQVFNFRVASHPDLPVKVAISSVFFTRELMYNKAYLGYWLQNIDNHIDMADIVSLTFWMAPDRDVELKLGPFALVQGEASDQVLSTKPFVDAFGQWMTEDWPGKIHSVGELRAAWEREDATLAKAEDFGYCPFGGWKARTERATGFFHTAQIDGRWWLVDPDGHLFFSSGPDAITSRTSTRVKGRETLFVKLPPGTGDFADFYRANAALRYGESDYAAHWKAKVVERLHAWGFNTVANWSDPILLKDPAMPFATSISAGATAKNWMGFPDVYSKEFAAKVQADAAARCARFREEPKLIGYFIGNEPSWPYHPLIESILKDPQASATQDFARAFLKEKGDTPATRALLLETVSRQYFRSICDAIHKADPHHVVMGIRFSRLPDFAPPCATCVQHQALPEPVLRASDVFDIVSFNDYSTGDRGDMMARIYDLVKKPIIIGEFHFGTAERGYGPGLVMMSNQTTRAQAFRHYLEAYASLPAVVGVHYFAWSDEPVTGRRGDGENYDIGFVDQMDVPYAEMVAAAQATHRRLYQVHGGEAQPIESDWAKTR